VGIEIESKQLETNKTLGLNSYIAESPVNAPLVETTSSIFVVLGIFFIVVLVLCALQKIHGTITKLLEFIVSVPWYKRTVLIVIGFISTYVTTKVSATYFSLPIILGYVTTFAFNEFSSKKDIEKAKSPLENKIKDKEKIIISFRRIIEDKKNTFQEIIINRINICVRITGKNDTDTLRKLKQKIGELQDIIFAEKTFIETPDEAIRRYENSVSGDIGMAAQTLFGDAV